MKNHLLWAQAGRGVWGARFRHWCILESQPWETLQLGQAEAWEGLVVAVVAHPRLRAGGTLGLVVTALFPLHGGPSFLPILPSV